MDVFENIGGNYNKYPNTAIALSTIVYDDLDKIRAEVQAQTGLDVVWGPAELKHLDDVSYSRAMIAADDATGEHYVVIRGTNFDSMSSWLLQDFDIDKAVPFSELPGQPPNVPADALISQGTFNGISDLLKLRSPDGQQSLLECLQARKPRYVYVTGHSLGGTLTPALFAYLNAMLNGGRPVSNMALWSFAGLTAGGAGFNAYFNAMLPDSQGFLWRIHNSLDIAPLCWYAFGAMEQIYVPQHALHWDAFERDLIADLFHQAARSGIGYSHPQDGQSLPGSFDPDVLDRHLWLSQALHQHHPTTYQALVGAAFPYSR